MKTVIKTVMIKKNPTHSVRSSRMLTRLPLVALLFMIALSVALPVALPCAAASADEKEPVKWTLSEDQSTLTGDGKTYTLYNMIPEWEVNPSGIYHYVQTFRLNARNVHISAPIDSSALVWLSDLDNTISMYVTDEGKRILDTLAAGKASYYRLEYDSTSGRRKATLPDTLFSRMDDTGAQEKRTVPVSSLASLKRYEICGYDATDTVRTVCGAVYKTADGWLYVDYRQLGNQYFDADGHFSYRAGEVTGSLLDQEVCEDLLEVASDMSRRIIEFKYERNEIADITDADDPANSDDTSISFFWVNFVFLGYLVPIAPFVLGLVMPHSAKQGYPKRWYLLSILAVVWIVVAIGITVLLTV